MILTKNDSIFSKAGFVLLCKLMAILGSVSAVISISAFVYIKNFSVPSWFPVCMFGYYPEFFGAVVTFMGLFWLFYGLNIYLSKKYGSFPYKWQQIHFLIEKKALLLLLIFAILLIVWFGALIFKNPYKYEYNHGNGAYYVQILHNLCNGFGPEHTTKFLTHRLQDNPYFFASAFSIAPHVLPLFLLTPIYCLLPVPPMHVFGIVIYAIFFGSFGIYYAIRCVGGSPFLSLLGAIGYCIIPWVERPILFHGAFDNLGYAVFPYVFAFLFAQKWRWFYISVFVLATINITYSYYVMGLGIVTAVFFRSPKQGILSFFIGFLVMLWQLGLMNESLCGIWNGNNQPPSLFNQYVLSFDFKSLIGPSLYYIVYIFDLLMTVSFIPLFAIRKERRWNWPMIGILCFLSVAISLGLFRSYTWTFHRNSSLVVPVYLSAFMAYVSLGKTGYINGRIPKARRDICILMGILLFSSITSISLWYTRNYPWSYLNISRTNPTKIMAKDTDNEIYEHILDKITEYVEGNASIAYRIEAGLQAFITNRQKAWYIGYNPDGVEYFVIQTRKIRCIDPNLPPWRPHLKKLENDHNFRLLYKDDIILIYKNLSPKYIPRLESVLGLDLIVKAIVPGRCTK